MTGEKKKVSVPNQRPGQPERELEKLALARKLGIRMFGEIFKETLCWVQMDRREKELREQLEKEKTNGGS